MTDLSVVGPAEPQVAMMIPEWLPDITHRFALGWRHTGPTVLVTQELIDAYADLIGDHQPIHVDAEAAKKMGLRGTIAHGHLVLSLTKRLLPLVQMLIDLGITVIRKAEASCEYTNMLYAESVISAEARITACRLKRSGDIELFHEYKVLGLGYEKPIIEGAQVLVCKKPAQLRESEPNRFLQ